MEAAKADLATLSAGSHPDAIAAAELHLQELIHASEFAQREHKRLSHLVEAKNASDTDKASSQSKHQAAVSATESKIQ